MIDRPSFAAENRVQVARWGRGSEPLESGAPSLVRRALWAIVAQLLGHSSQTEVLMRDATGWETGLRVPNRPRRLA